MTNDEPADAIMAFVVAQFAPQDPEYPWWPMEPHDVRAGLVTILREADAERAEAEPVWSPA